MADNSALPLIVLSEQFAKLPGIGMKTAQRLAYAVMSMSEEEARQFAEAIISAKTDVGYCKICQNLTEFDVCPICSDTNRDDSVVCVVETPKDVTALKELMNTAEPIMSFTVCCLRLTESVRTI